jgi:4-amino-4-deoxy-L-arabinose transferase-like glycosyltransferase
MTPPPASRREILALAALTVLPLLPFLSAAFSIDAPVFVAVASQIAAHPTDPFGFDMIWDPTAPQVAIFNRNPPLLSYWLAPAVALFGEREVVVHALLLPFSLVASLSFYGIARRVAGVGLAPAALLVATPAFLVLAAAVMLDVPVLACMLFAVYAFLRGVEQGGGGRWEWIAGAAAAAAGVMKYVGFSIAPLLAAGIVLLHPRKTRATLYVVGLPVLVWALWGLWTWELYGAVHYWISTDLVQEKSFEPDDFWNQVVSTPIFYGMALVFPAFVALRSLLAGHRSSLVGVLGLLVGAVAVQVILPEGEPSRRHPLEPDEAVLAAVGCAGAIYLWSLAIARFRESVLDRFLILWLGGITFWTLFLNWHVNSADALLAAPPALLLLFRSEVLRPPGRVAAIWVALMLPLSIGLVWADSVQGGAYRKVAARIVDEIGDRPGSRWFVGHWGYQYYMERAGFQAVVPPQYERWYGKSELEKGDWVSSARNVSQLDVSQNMHLYRIRGAWSWDENWWLPLRTANADAGASFYSHHGGYVPYAFSTKLIDTVGLGKVIGAKPRTRLPPRDEAPAP